MNLLHKFNLGLFCLLLNAPYVYANPELDRRYSLSTIGILKTWDNVDGVFSEYVTDAYKEYFSKQSRFAVQEAAKIETVLSKSKLQLKEIIEDKDILSQIARSARVDTLLRTKIIKEGPQYTFKIEWLLAPQILTLGSDQFVLDEVRNPKALENLKVAVQRSLGKALSQVPFLASVTGRDGDSVTVNIGANLNLHKGDTLVVATVDDAKNHPLLHSVVDWRLTPTGRIEVDQIEESIAFGRIVFEEENQTVLRDQKIVRVIKKVFNPEKEEAPDAPVLDEPPRNGFAGGGISLGSFSRDKSSGTSGATGGGTVFGGDGELELWLNRQFFADLGLKLGAFSYSQKDLATGAESFSGGKTSSTISQFRLNGGYNYHLTQDFFGPRVAVKLGYHSISYNLPSLSPSAGAAIGRVDPISFNSLFLGIQGDLPIEEQWNILIDLNFGIFSSATESSNSGASVNSASDGSFFFGALYKLKPRISLRGGLNFQINSADFSDGSTLSHKVVTFSPAILYYF